MSQKEFDGDAGAPLPDFSGARNIQLGTIAPALGVGGGQKKPDYLDFDQKGRGVVVTMFANAGMSYLIGIAGGGLYGLQKGVASTPSSKFKVQVNSILNHCGRYGSKTGNTFGVFAVMYSLYEGLGDHVSTIQRWLGVCVCVWQFLGTLISHNAYSFVLVGFGRTFGSRIGYSATRCGLDGIYLLCTFRFESGWISRCFGFGCGRCHLCRIFRAWETLWEPRIFVFIKQ